MIAVAGASPTQASDCSVVATVKEVGPGIYVRPGQPRELFGENPYANVGFVVGEECIAIIDTGGGVPEGDALRCAAEQVADVPICYVILTHYHFDHAYGTAPFRALSRGRKPEVIGHARLRRALEQSATYYLPRLAQARSYKMTPDDIVVPDRTVARGETLVLDLGGRELALTAHSPAHTDNDLSVLDRKTGTLWLSDLLFVDHVPTIDSSTGSLLGWLELLDELADAPATQAVPGHGPNAVKWPSGRDNLKRYLSVVRDETRVVIENGGTITDAQGTVAKDEASRWQHFNVHHRRTVQKAFTELEWE
ncbi:MAG: quinoprotein relay system zinc metallohydrolase 2 [Pseudomonadota bacterium]